MRAFVITIQHNEKSVTAAKRCIESGKKLINMSKCGKHNHQILLTFINGLAKNTYQTDIFTKSIQDLRTVWQHSHLITHYGNIV